LVEAAALRHPTHVVRRRLVVVVVVVVVLLLLLLLLFLLLRMVRVAVLLRHRVRRCWRHHLAVHQAGV
jgi:hypothetical protein